MASNTFEHITFLAWFVADLCMVCVAVICGAHGNRFRTAKRLFVANVLALLLHSVIARSVSSPVIAASFTGVFEQVRLSWWSVYDLIEKQDTRGHSLEIW